MLLRIIPIWCFLVFGFSAFAQNNAAIAKGDACMRSGDYSKAAVLYKKVVDGDNNDLAAQQKLGKALMAASDFKGAEVVYKLLAANPKADDINRFYYAQVLRINSKYTEAGAAYQSYFEAHPNDPLAAEFKDFAANVKPLLVDPKVYSLTNIAGNTAGSDEGPTFCLYDLCFSSNGHSKGARKNTYDLYLLRGGNPSNPAVPKKLKGDINGNLDEGPATFSRNGLEMIFTRSNYDHKSADGSMKLGLYHADYDTAAKTWINIAPLNINDYNYNFMQPSLSKGGDTLFFVSDMKGGLGETDIYISYRQGKTWSAPVNLGSGINTMGKEQTPFIADDGTLYFASDSRMGLGGLDIYKTALVNSVWGHPVNLGAGLNSAYNDFGFVNSPTGQSGYIVSNRPGGMGGNDIYQFFINAALRKGVGPAVK